MEQAYGVGKIAIIEKLEEKVEKYLSEGWKLQGGVSISNAGIDRIEKWIVTQAIIKE